MLDILDVPAPLVKGMHGVEEEDDQDGNHAQRIQVVQAGGTIGSVGWEL